jgi:type IV pilus assembly protein PilB
VSGTPSPADASWALASSEEEQARALALRYGLEYVNVASFAPDPELLKSVPVELMFRYAFLPYRREGDRLVLVMADPTALPVIDELSLVLQTQVQPAVGTPPRSRRRSSAARAPSACWSRPPSPSRSS